MEGWAVTRKCNLDGRPFGIFTSDKTQAQSAANGWTPESWMKVWPQDEDVHMMAHWNGVGGGGEDGGQVMSDRLARGIDCFRHSAGWGTAHPVWAWLVRHLDFPVFHMQTLQHAVESRKRGLGPRIAAAFLALVIHTFLTLDENNENNTARMNLLFIMLIESWRGFPTSPRLSSHQSQP
jgi:hypothetical protein